MDKNSAQKPDCSVNEIILDIERKYICKAKFCSYTYVLYNLGSHIVYIYL